MVQLISCPREANATIHPTQMRKGSSEQTPHVIYGKPLWSFETHDTLLLLDTSPEVLHSHSSRLQFMKPYHERPLYKI